MNKPTRQEIQNMPGGAINNLLNACLIPLLSELRMGNRQRNYYVNDDDATDAKEALRSLGFRFKFAELESGCAAAFDRSLTESTPYQIADEGSEAAATARAAAITIVEQTELFNRPAEILFSRNA